MMSRIFGFLFAAIMSVGWGGLLYSFLMMVYPIRWPFESNQEWQNAWNSFHGFAAFVIAMWIFMSFLFFMAAKWWTDE